MVDSAERRVRRHAPVSLEAERRRVMITVHRVEKDLHRFWESWLKTAKADFVEIWLDFILRVDQKLGNKRPPKDASEFDSHLRRFEYDPEFSQRPEVNQLKQICARSLTFDEIVLKSRARLQQAVEDHLAKYCLSFVAEVDDMDIPSVLEYENNISEWRGTIYKSFDEVDKVYSELRKYSDNFCAYVENYAKVLSIMERTCDAFRPIFEPVKNWVMTDENYPRRLQDDINKLNKRKLDIQQVGRRIHRNVGADKSRINRRRYQSLQIEKQMQDLLEERRFYRKKEITARENFAKIDADLERKKGDLRDIAEQYKSRRHIVSDRTLQMWTDMAERIQEDIGVLKLKLEKTRSQVAHLQKERYFVQKRIHKVQGDLEDSVKRKEAVTNNVASEEDDIRYTQEELKTIATKLEVLAKIREIKLHSDTVKKIYFYGYSPGGKLIIKDPLEEAFKLTASEIGKEWSLLYQRLPFKPDRDIVSRAHDIETIDITSRRLDADFATLSLKSLDKWRRLSEYVTVNALVGTLRRINKGHVAQKIERILLA
ncbi:structural maintenance of chromosomes protein 1A-like [Liolophura sinensis]|uniref:structural maintenance of chromosomes protein 1A-like n=1 Tax=Liolophura sinensis TaxID=3198878 RepID=UPI003158513F